ncbi:helicase protein [Dictyocaulus viviparus]|uniref:Helicase protein n=1 Tax=Dictyocaulus viviparus TaxID=29172 RepID=A0A0D8XJ35_DICVI|nr:helicase protein [Dictyocaulus viviparus]
MISYITRRVISFKNTRLYSSNELKVLGGLDLKTQEAALRSGPDVVVATPGRLIDHLHNSPSFSLNNIEVLVLDEADRMLDEAFEDQMKELIRLCARNRQTLLFSATMTDQIDELVSMSLKNPVKVFVNENTDTALKLRQEFVRIRAGRETDREAIVSALVTRTFQENTIIFVRMKKDCQRMHILLGLLGLKVRQMHSSISQAQRIEALSKFTRREIDILVSTDLASRGLDIEGVQTVINMHMPRSVKQYIHRVGRTARAGKAGRSISLVGEDDRKLLKEIIRTNPNRILKQRLVAPEVVEAYRQRIDSLEDAIRQIDLEEKEEKELRLAELAVQKTEEKLETGKTEREGRVWFKKATEGERKRKRMEKKALRKEELKRKQEQKTPEQIRLEHEMAYLAREAKRARRGKHQRLRAIVETSRVVVLLIFAL